MSSTAIRPIAWPSIATGIKLDFDPDDQRRVDKLSAQAQKGTLTPDERAKLAEYARVNTLRTILQSKPRLSLKRSGREAGRMNQSFVAIFVPEATRIDPSIFRVMLGQ